MGIQLGAIHPEYATLPTPLAQGKSHPVPSRFLPFDSSGPTCLTLFASESRVDPFIVCSSPSAGYGYNSIYFSTGRGGPLLFSSSSPGFLIEINAYNSNISDIPTPAFTAQLTSPISRNAVARSARVFAFTSLSFNTSSHTLRITLSTSSFAPCTPGASVSNSTRECRRTHLPDNPDALFRRLFLELLDVFRRKARLLGVL